MIDYFESSVRIEPDSIFFTFVDNTGEEVAYTYWDARLISAALARRFQAAGMRAGDYVAVSVSNSPELVFIALACAYSGLVMVLIDEALTQSERLSCTLDLERAGHKIACDIDENLAQRLLHDVRHLPDDDAQIIREICANTRRGRSIMGEGQDAIDETVHYAERASHLYDRSTVAVVGFVGAKASRSTSEGETRAKGKRKAVPLTWANLLDAAVIANRALAPGQVRTRQERLPFNSANLSNSETISRSDPPVVWQCALPLTSIDGLQCLIRSLVARSPFRLYATDAAEAILRDGEDELVTHIAADETLMQDLLAVEEWRSDVINGVRSRLARYRCVLMVGKINPTTVERARSLGVALFASYGQPQTSGVMAASAVSQGFRGALYPMEGYEVRVIDPDEEGFGRLAVRGPGVFDGYLNAQTAFTVDHFFITEAKGALVEDGRVLVKSRFDDMFVSAGQNIYPSEVADVFRHVPGVSGVHVFGVPDSRFGMVPVAAIERSDPALTPQVIENTTHAWFSNTTVPINIFVFDQLPRMQNGKLDRPAIEAVFAS